MEDFNLVMKSDADVLEIPWVVSHKLVLVIHSRCLSLQDRMISVVTQPKVLAAGLWPLRTCPMCPGHCG